FEARGRLPFRPEPAEVLPLPDRRTAPPGPLRRGSPPQWFPRGNVSRKLPLSRLVARLRKMDRRDHSPGLPRNLFPPFPETPEVETVASARTRSRMAAAIPRQPRFPPPRPRVED